jgi:type I restriction enzyme S subunit
MMSSKRLASNNNQVRKGYKKTAIGLIPEDWEVKDISAVCLLQRGFDITESTRKFGNVPVYSSSGLAYFHNQAKVNPPGVVTGRKGILGKVFYIEEPFWPHDTTLWIKDFKGNDAKYISFFLTYFNLERFDASTSVPTLNRNNLATISIPVPPLPEQKAIAQTLSDVDILIAALDKLIAKKRNIKTATMQQLLTGKTRLPGFGGEWEIKKLGELGIFSKGSGIRKNDVLDDGLPCIRYGEIYTKHNDYIKEFYSFISEDVATISYQLKSGDLLFAGSGETSKEIGKCVAFLGDILAYAGSDIIVFSPQNQDSLFFGYLMNYESIVKQKSQRGQGDAVVHIQAKNLAQLTLHLPPLPEQQAIAQVLSDMDKEIAALEKRRTKTQAIKQGMMQELLTGKTRLINN